MSSDINPDVPPRIRCEAISSSTSPNAICHRAHGTVLRYPGTSRTNTSADDPALLIGLALGHVRQGDALTGIVPKMLIARLQAQADSGNPACLLLLDWLERRNNDLVPLSSHGSIKPLPAQQRPGRRMIREWRQAGPGSLKKRGPKTTAPSDTSAAIIATKTEGRIDE
ncbi:hypothetical protein [Agrobacterium sp. SUL3]|uniref:hypothetical protein n=1 Tax=Agrobacterium sp. SUL3 TaxID=1701910 RepID=UPI00069C0143|nr:hypothetical protein [Agrobacterium sp. SUL3]KNY30627.1 hypothetical protein AKG12_29025 [Agrobacterium sp. SUL3]